MEDKQRSALRATVVKVRRLLEKDFQGQLAGTYNILPDGRVLESAPGDPVVRARLLDVIRHHRAGGASAPEAVVRVVREAAFTVLNRFAALKMAERRHLVRECASQGIQSEGIRELAECAPGLRGALDDGGYRLLLEAVMDEISLDLKVLFNRRDSMAPLWPGPKALGDLLKALNDPQLADVWADDTAIGWVYQDFNDNDVKEMRDSAKGGAPRNSRELAVRNQFFTPRYVVEFLTDNTLGRLWYEMTGGVTVLRERCRYLVRRPTEIFLKSGESVPVTATVAEAGAEQTLSQEELLQQPVHIPHRPLKDPRDIRLLDPACGSMHFGLYAFDLLTVIYEEAWDIAHGQDDDAKSVETFAPFGAFAATFPGKAAFLRDVPRLIVERNIHGIDIDPRAVQIAGLSLWLRAQRAWHQVGVKPADRPRITRSNLVCAEPMPGEKELLREFVEQQFPAGERPAFAFLLEEIFDRMALAGEAGSLLRIEEDIRTAIADAKRLWKEAPKHEQASLFSEPGEKPDQGQMRLDLSGITDEQFWERAEQRIYDALEAYAEQAQNGGGFQRRLFAADAAQGFAFIDLCRKRYDVVVMNPPFGLVTDVVFEFLQRAYPDNYVDVYAAFVARGAELASDGLVGAITSRSFVSSKKLQRWREHQLLECLSLLIDLGKGVMDDANIESACYTIRPDGKCSTGIVAFDGRQHHEDLPAMLAANELLSSGKAFLSSRQFLRTLPGSKLLYFASGRLAEILVHRTCFEPTVGTVRKGLTTFDDFRFLRARWEVPPEFVGRGKTWELFAKGGEYSNYYIDVHLVVKRQNRGEELAEKNNQVNGQTAQSRQGETYYYKAGSQYTGRSQAGFSARAIPADCVMSSNAPMILSESGVSRLYLLGWVNSRLIRSLIEMQAMDNDFVPGLLKNLPWLDIPKTTEEEVAKRTLELVETHRRFSALDESDPNFSLLDGLSRGRLSAWFSELQANVTESIARVAEHQAFITSEIDKAYDFESGALGLEVLGRDVVGEVRLPRVTLKNTAEDAVSYVLGCALGRWDIRFATGERPAPELPDPFAALPVCPPGMLQGDDGLPLSPEAGRRLRAEGRYPLDVAWDGILVDDPEHPLDLERRVHAALAVIWGDRADALEQEACALLGVPTLREWFRRPASFFADHLKRYSKSRRQAPIYWPLSTASGSFTIWVYYHRLTADTLFQLAEYAELKLGRIRDERLRAAAEHAKAEGREAARLAKQAGELIALEQELEEMKAELLRVAALPYRPELDDGVQITAAPLWKLFRLSKWRKELETTWKSLENAEYDWAHLAYAIWPDRVREKCKTDRSMAIAHGLEDLCRVEVKTQKKRRSKEGS